MAESNTLKRVQVALSKFRDIRLFRNNTGKGWQGVQEWEGRNKLILHNPRPLDAGLFKGSSDLIGWRSVEITPEMVGRTVAVFVAIEIKSGSTRTSADQRTWITNVQAAGGLAGIARNPEDAFLIVNQF